MSLEQALAENTAALRELSQLLREGQLAAAQVLERVVPTAEEVIHTELKPKKAKADPKPEAAPESEPTLTASASSWPCAAASYEDAKAAVLNVSKAKGREAAVELLQRFGVSRLPEVKPEQFSELVAYAQEMLEGQEA